jgi:D-galactarolactone isomerase
MNTMTHATDCHVHLYEPERFPIPSPVPTASWTDYQDVQRRLGLERAVLVQPIGYGFDNACLLDGLRQAGGSARGIVVIRPETPFSEIVKLHEAGVRGVRFMMIAGAGGALDWEALEPLSAKIAELGWVINLQLDGRDLAAYEARLRALPSKLSIDHTGKFLEPVGTGHAGFQALLRLLDCGKTWVKVSAPYETSKVGAPHYDDVSVLAKALVAAHPARCLWASNWPHPGREPKPDDGAMLELLDHWAPDEKVRQQILVSNPAQLYHFD